MSTVSISSLPSQPPKRLCNSDAVLSRSVATTCQPRFRYSSAKANPRPRDAPMRRSFLLDDRGGIYRLQLSAWRNNGDAWKLYGDVLAKQRALKGAAAKYDEALKYAPNWQELKTARAAA